MKWKSTKYPGVRCRPHPTRKHGVQPDRYFAIRYQRDNNRKEEGLGWASEGWTAEKAANELAELRKAYTLGNGPVRLFEKRQEEMARRDHAATEKKRLLRDAVTVAEFFIKTYFPQAKADKKPQTARREEGLFNKYLKPVLGDLPLRDVMPLHLERIKKNMKDANQSDRSIEYALAVVRQVFNAARRVGLYQSNPPTDKVKKPRVDNQRMRFLTMDESGELLNALNDKSKDVHDQTLLALHCGLRFGEIASLTWADADLDKGILVIRDAKTGSRHAFLTDQASAMLRKRHRGAAQDFIFQKKGRGKLEKVSHTFWRTIGQLGFNSGIIDRRQRVCFHTCRHSYASWLIEQGRDLYVVQKLLGHKTNKMTQRYAHLVDRKLMEAAKLLGEVLKNESRGVGVNELTIRNIDKTTL